ncbi:excinuclease ATPase subunit [Lactobacillus selangorensis]|uniref:UvrABC system protein A n=1 Tax=Lactobacillus selangorensis TaxID=81857 RepID=A0A0R2FPW8_9LACO|nr:excinuclease ABC subunit UvrA [Lactobacillus selangorensis]KRN27967.1 excinuclease ATPase subunit [Lactobacillus selangorensis]KRN30562.1 excinuclease ATPase subunit [Lactobacillus selangorensis]
MPIQHRETIPTVIEVRGAHVHNLKNLNVNIPLNAFVVLTGLSGSGKSSLAMGVLYAEGARRYLNALSTYTRRRISQVEKADVDSVRYLPSALALRQRPTVPSIRSTVGTMTESLNVLRLIFSRLGSPRCPNGHQIPPTIAISHAMDLTGEQMGKITCPVCGVVFEAFSAEDFAFNAEGACPTCDGTGTVRQIKADLLIPDPTKTLREGAVASWHLPGRTFVINIAQAAGIDIDTPFQDLSKKDQDFVLHGPRNEYETDIPSKTGRVFHMDHAVYENAFNAVEDSMKSTTNERTIKQLNRFYSFDVCPTCHGSRFKPELMTQLLVDKNIAQISDMTLTELADFIPKVKAWLPANMQSLADNLLGELTDSLQPMIDLGLDYLTLSRAGNTLSTGELQRIQLGRTLRSQTTGVLYVLDEPSVGLHPANVDGLIKVLRSLVSQGNSLVVVDHDESLIAAADYVIEIGPGAGAEGGTIVDQGTVPEIEASPKSLIGPFLTGKAQLRTRAVMPEKELFKEGTLALHITDRFNIKDLTAQFPIGRFNVVSGFSGAGKSTLILDGLIPAIQAKGQHRPGPKFVTNLKTGPIKNVVTVNSVPIGKNSRSTVATYSGILDSLRKLYARTPEAKKRHWTASRFSYNVKDGACPTCHGTGTISLDIQYLPDMVEVCPTCHGKRYAQDTLEVKWHGMSIADALDLSVEAALPVFKKVPSIERILGYLEDMGLGYLILGESTPMLSGGEAQRLKLISSMGHSQKDTLFVFDEPSVGLHPLDIQVLVKVFDQLIQSGATIIAIEHDLDVLSNADYIVDMGPKGGIHGGQIVATGTPKEVAADPNSITGHYLKEHLKQFGVK